MTEKMTIMEVYQRVMGEAQYHRAEAEKFATIGKRTKEDIEAHNHQIGLSQCFYQVAAWLENTEEINPTKGV